MINFYISAATHTKHGLG